MPTLALSPGSTMILIGICTVLFILIVYLFCDYRDWNIVVDDLDYRIMKKGNTVVDTSTIAANYELSDTKELVFVKQEVEATGPVTIVPESKDVKAQHLAPLEVKYLATDPRSVCRRDNKQFSMILERLTAPLASYPETYRFAAKPTPDLDFRFQNMVQAYNQQVIDDQQMDREIFRYYGKLQEFICKHHQGLPHDAFRSHAWPGPFHDTVVNPITAHNCDVLGYTVLWNTGEGFCMLFKENTLWLGFEFYNHLYVTRFDDFKGDADHPFYDIRDTDPDAITFPFWTLHAYHDTDITVMSPVTFKLKPNPAVQTVERVLPPGFFWENYGHYWVISQAEWGHLPILKTTWANEFITPPQGTVYVKEDYLDQLVDGFWLYDHLELFKTLRKYGYYYDIATGSTNTTLYPLIMTTRKFKIHQIQRLPCINVLLDYLWPRVSAHRDEFEDIFSSDKDMDAFFDKFSQPVKYDYDPVTDVDHYAFYEANSKYNLTSLADIKRVQVEKTIPLLHVDGPDAIHAIERVSPNKIQFDFSRARSHDSCGYVEPDILRTDYHVRVVESRVNINDLLRVYKLIDKLSINPVNANKIYSQIQKMHLSCDPEVINDLILTASLLVSRFMQRDFCLPPAYGSVRFQCQLSLKD